MHPMRKDAVACLGFLLYVSTRWLQTFPREDLFKLFGEVVVSIGGVNVVMKVFAIGYGAIDFSVELTQM